MTPQPEDLRQLLELIRMDPAAAAVRLDQMADRLHCLAELARTAAREGMRDSGAAADRVRMQLVGSDGKVRSTHDTGNRP